MFHLFYFLNWNPNIYYIIKHSNHFPAKSPTRARGKKKTREKEERRGREKEKRKRLATAASMITVHVSLQRIGHVVWFVSAIVTFGVFAETEE